MAVLKRRQRIRNGFIIFSFLLFPITIFYLSPVLVIQGAYKGLLVGSAIVFMAQFILALVLGRSFCAWVCPAGGLQDICFSINNKTVSGKFNWIRYLIWVPWMGIILWGLLNANQISISIFYQIENGISVDEPLKYIIYFFFILIIISFSILGGKRAFCKYICWMSPLMIIGTKLQLLLKIPGLKMVNKSENCKKCKQCISACPMSLNVQQLVLDYDIIKHTECIQCGSCADICKSEVIRFKFTNR